MTPRISAALSAAALLGAATLTTTSAYAADPTALSATGALQQVDVPAGTCSATVTAVGGNGGQATTAGGHGASVTATVPIVSGTLTVVVGTPGIRGSRMSDQDPLMSSPDFDPYVGSGGGGGGTFVFEGASTTDAGLLVAAGGGGGGSRNTVPPGLDGATTPDGTRGNDIWVFDGGGAGGTGGLGGGYDPYGGGNGGGGLRGGGNGYAGSSTMAGQSALDGAAGGDSVYDNGLGDGGYGGGGGANSTAGGGGGYSGGGGAGGSGGSFVTAAATDAPTYGLNGDASGNGSVSIVWHTCPAPVTTHSVTLDPADGDAPTVLTVNDGDTVTAPHPTRSGYDLTGWYVAAAPTDTTGTPWDFTTPVTTDLLLKAAWQPVVVTARPRFCNGLRATIVGTNGADVLHGTSGRDVIWAGAGNDRVAGLGGADMICGGDGNDRIDGGAGNDVLSGGTGRDRLYGEGGRDLLLGGAGTDLLDGGPGRDRILQ